ncbi:pyridoxamine 5'-phosphate oxidase family protein [Nakamurella leprariae]|uniref:Pyridoxamine 5'-phosphate oxidase family protein n=1 Tax=Nakamurella leprariae TaxID=2803911 RepID=A0A939C0R3_9ACTN|nr:pyridoxamine 5'-phosphate oxidase family protein [Nakamurella leprariae]MBM9466314.1 pyridoxamine 5'-phosphate oxidase family protein [Nakamurella leprariae]
MTDQTQTSGPAGDPERTGTGGPDDRSHDEHVAKIAELVKDARFAMLATMTPDGKHVSRPMALQQVEFDGDLWFLAYDDSDKAKEIEANPSVNVSFSDPKDSSFTSISGTAEIVHDRAKAQEFWNPVMNAWFPDGLETPGLALIKVHADSAEYWDSPDNGVVRLLGMIKAAVTRQPEQMPSDHRTVEL